MSAWFSFIRHSRAGGKPAGLLVLFLFVLAMCTTGCNCGGAASTEGKLTVTFLNVAAPINPKFVHGNEYAEEWRTAGVGDAILISTPGGKNYLIDGGLWGRGEAVIVPALKARGITQLDMVIITHGHGDHYGGLEYVIANFPVKELATNGISQSTRAYRDLLAAAKAKGVAYRELKEGDILNWDEGVTATVLKAACRELEWNDANNQSVVIKLAYGTTSFLFTGDASWQAEEYLLKHHREELACDVLKVGHHGSTSASSIDFLLAVCPPAAEIEEYIDTRPGFPPASPHIETGFPPASPHIETTGGSEIPRAGSCIAVASVDTDNRFEFPPVATLEKYQAVHIPFLFTGQSGNITVISDGRKVTEVRYERSLGNNASIASNASDPKVLEGFRLSDKAWHLIQANDYEGALPLLEKAATLAPNSASVHSRLGYCYKKLRDFDSARTELERAVEINPNESYAQLHLGHLYHIIDHDEVKAGEHLSIYLRQQPQGQFAELAHEWLGDGVLTNRAPREEPR